MSERLGSRAVVLGAGIAGLVTARVLADRYAQVVVVERNTVVGVTGPRAGVPQGHHAHALLARGQEVMERLFPGMQADLTADGVLSGDLSGDLRWYLRGRALQQSHSRLTSVSANRPTLEACVRRRVVEMPDVLVRERTVVQGLATTSDHSRVTGVRVVGDEPGATPETIDADLVVDATGRGSRTPVWLEQFGYQRPAEDKVRIDLAYVSQYFRLRTDPFGTDLAINSVPHPGNTRGAFFGKFPDDVALLSLTGLLGDHPPRDPDGFLAFARSLPVPDVYDGLRDAEPLTEPVTFTFPASLRRRYERLSRFPERLLVLGDAVCSFNPVYGQGMTVAAIEAMTLRTWLLRGVPPEPRGFLRDIGRVVDVPWQISTSGDLDFPGVPGKRSAMVRMGNAYMARVQYAATKDQSVTATFMRVAGLVDPPSALMRPGFVRRVLRLSHDRTTGPAAESLTAFDRTDQLERPRHETVPHRDSAGRHRRSQPSVGRRPLARTTGRRRLEPRCTGVVPA
ncbi:FAD-dependent oxidoreductase [Solwaraspora sp. WMMD791]|uniref:FAD-dependent oxidoreductase n=1 Tax=Solwaraspora sp. WMMD791 TaxID=3016086 RepID=UPI00249A4C40|nr:FAD-dependent oxidoreductase [Solwaraspora sp. WMMD791]WFE28253.1 FAD-dependent oxidoreductase [Solwaraspora sp. WMMD791]